MSKGTFIFRLLLSFVLVGWAVYTCRLLVWLFDKLSNDLATIGIWIVDPKILDDIDE